MRHMPKSYSQIHVDNQNVLWAYLPNSTLSQVASFSTFQLQTLPYCAILQPTDLSDLVWHCSLLLLWIPKPFCESSWAWQGNPRASTRTRYWFALGNPQNMYGMSVFMSLSLVLNQCTVLLYIIISSVVILYHYHSDYLCHCFVIILIIDMCNILWYDWYDEIWNLYPISMYFIFWSLRIQLYAWAPDTEPKTWAQGKDIALTLDSLDLKILEIWKLRFNWRFWTSFRRFWKLETDSEAWSFDAFLGFLDVPHETRTQGQLATISADFAKALDKVTASNSM